MADRPSFGEAMFELKTTSPKKDSEETDEMESFTVAGEIAGIRFSAGWQCLLLNRLETRESWDLCRAEDEPNKTGTNNEECDFTASGVSCQKR